MSILSQLRRLQHGQNTEEQNFAATTSDFSNAYGLQDETQHYK
jgi:hypothetical protein